MTLPPFSSIARRALEEHCITCRCSGVSPRLSAPLASSFTPLRTWWLTAPLSRRCFIVITCVGSSFRSSTHACSLSRLSGAYSLRKRFTKPRLGVRKASGVCPPSKPIMLPLPERDFWPLWPRPAVLPLPEPMPRPTRLPCLFLFGSNSEPRLRSGGGGGGGGAPGAEDEQCADAAAAELQPEEYAA